MIFQWHGDLLGGDTAVFILFAAFDPTWAINRTITFLQFMSSIRCMILKTVVLREFVHGSLR